jgi:uncharacterized protein
MRISDDTMLSKKPFSKMINSRHVIFCIILFFVLSQYTNLLIPSKYLEEYLVSHTLVFTLIIVTIYYLSLLYSPKQSSPPNTGKLILYCLGGLIICVIINFPHVSYNLHIKPKEYAFFVNYGAEAKLYFLVMLCVVGPILEEILCRFYVYNMIKDDLNIITGIIVSSFTYMILHGLRIDFLYLFVHGVIYAVVYEKTKTIWSSIIVHSFNNLIWFTLVYNA